MTDPQAAPLSAEELAKAQKDFAYYASLQRPKAKYGLDWSYIGDGGRLLATITALQGELADAQNGWTKALNTASDYLIRAEAAESALTAERKAKASPHGGMERHVIYKALLNIASQYSYGTAGMCTDMTDAILALTAQDVSATSEPPQTPLTREVTPDGN